MKTPVKTFSDMLFHYFRAMNLQKAAKRLKEDVGFIPVPTLLNQQKHLLMKPGG
jgi:hypothetical protein